MASKNPHKEPLSPGNSVLLGLQLENGQHPPFLVLLMSLAHMAPSVLLPSELAWPLTPGATFPEKHQTNARWRHVTEQQ